MFSWNLFASVLLQCSGICPPLPPPTSQDHPHIAGFKWSWFPATVCRSLAGIPLVYTNIFTWIRYITPYDSNSYLVYHEMYGTPLIPSSWEYIYICISTRLLRLNANHLQDNKVAHTTSKIIQVMFVCLKKFLRLGVNRGMTMVCRMLGMHLRCARCEFTARCHGKLGLFETNLFLCWLSLSI